ncbi:MAG: hypothetical protein ACRD5K_12250 [Candidatus Acidiferrales bacterium]
MAKFLLCIMMSAALLAPLARAQDSTAPAATPSVADAARAERERQKSQTPERVITNDDIAPKIGPADGADAGPSKQEVRAELEKRYPPSFFTMANLMQQITKLQGVAARGDAGMLTVFKRSALVGYETVEFPGKKEWEERVSIATSHMVEEAGKGATRLEAIVDDNKNAIAGRDPAALARVRETWIDALLPYATWQQRTRDLADDGKARAKAYATGNPVGVTEYGHEAVERTEIAVAGILGPLAIMENEIRNVRGRYICDPAEWPHDPNFPKAPTALQMTFTQVSQAGYRLDFEGCGASHYSALAVPPESDGSQGRAFCMDESGLVRVSPDGNAATCVSRGSRWGGR